MTSVLKQTEVRVGLDLELRVLGDLLQLVQVVPIRLVLLVHKVVIELLLCVIS